MMRCSTCSAWWSGDGVRIYPELVPPPLPDQKCPCGGVLEAVDMERHLASLPYVPMKPPGSAGE